MIKFIIVALAVVGAKKIFNDCYDAKTGYFSMPKIKIPKRIKIVNRGNGKYAVRKGYGFIDTYEYRDIRKGEDFWWHTDIASDCFEGTIEQCQKAMANMGLSETVVSE